MKICLMEIMIKEDDQKDLFRFIHGGQSWDPNPPKIDKPVEELVCQRSTMIIFQYFRRRNAIEEAMGSWYRVKTRFCAEEI